MGLGSQAAGISGAVAGVGGVGDALGVVPTAVKTADYTLVAGDLALSDTSSGNVIFTLPTAPPNGTICGAKVVTTHAAYTNTTTVTAGGADLINKAATTTWVLSTDGRAVLLIYRAANSTWYTIDGMNPTTTPLSKLATPVGAVGFGAQNLTGVADPAAALHGMNKQYADANYGKLTPTVGTSLAGTGTVNLDLSTLNDTIQTITLSGNITFTTSNRAAGRRVTLLITSDASIRTFTFPSWIFVGGAAPANIAASKTALLEVICPSTTDAATVARYAVQP